MTAVSNLRGLARLGFGLTEFVKEPISVGTAKRRIARQLQLRQETFLQILDQAVFRNAQSPYLKLFRLAGCEFGDVRSMVIRDGPEGALEQFLKAGIYVSFEEFKGFSPAVRGSQTFEFGESDFDNPLITRHFQSSSGGTRGRPTRVVVDLEHIRQSVPHWAVWFAEHGLMDAPLVYYTPTHPGICNGLLRCAGFGKGLSKWFAIAKWRLFGTGSSRVLFTSWFGAPWESSVPRRYRLKKAGGSESIWPTCLARGQRPCLNTYPSTSVRICHAMEERGISLEGSTFLLRGEALTAQMRSAIESAGARAVQSYGFSEGGTVGAQCSHPSCPDDVHLFEDAFAVVQRERHSAEGTPAGSLLLTALRRACPKILLNTEIGDHAILENRSCDCLFGALGYRKHLHTIRGFDKVTGDGMTFFGPDIVRILQERLPQTFGGAMTDYQLIEEEDARGVSQYALLVNPTLGPLDEQTVAAAFLENLAGLRRYYRFKTNLWAQVGTLRVRRQCPVLTKRGKFLPLRSFRR